jgi:hypothetical protein
VESYNTYKISFFRAGLFRRSQELIYAVAEGAQSINTKLNNYIRQQEHDGEMFDETKIELVRTFMR